MFFNFMKGSFILTLKNGKSLSFSKVGQYAYSRDVVHVTNCRVSCRVIVIYNFEFFEGFLVLY